MNVISGRTPVRILLTLALPTLLLGGAEPALAQSKRCEVIIAVTNAVQANALQVEVNHSAAPAGEFSKVDCVVTGAPPALAEIDVGGPIVEVAWVNLASLFVGPKVFASCQFFLSSPSETLDAADFVPTVKDCTKGNPPVACTASFSVAIGSCTDVVPVCGNFAREIGEACDEGPNGDETCTSRCTPSGGCTDEPLAGCRAGAAGRSKIQLRDDPNDAADNKKDQGRFDWKNGAATDIEDFGDPVAGTPSYHWCVYDEDGLVLGAEIRGGGTCDGKPCWKKSGATKFQYKSKSGDADGVAQLKLTAGGEGKASIGVKAKSKIGNFVAPRPMVFTPRSISQLVVENGVSSTCFSTLFSLAGKNDTREYSAKGP